MVPNCRYNSIHSNTTYDVYANNSDVYADWAWWDGSSGNNYTTNGGYISDSMPLGSDPGGGSPLAKVIGNGKDFDPREVDTNDPKQLLELAKYQRYTAEEKEATKTLKDLINRFPNSKYTEKAIVQLFHLSDNINDSGFKKYLYNQKSRKLTSRLKGIITDLIILKSIEDKEYKIVEELCNEVLVSNFSNDSKVFALYQLVSIYNRFLIDRKKADQYLEKMKSMYPNNNLTYQAMMDMDEEVEIDQIKSLEKENYNNIEKMIVDFKLQPAYPNPFNPKTTIPFSLSKQSKINIKIYDLNGKEVWKWGNSQEYGVGNHKVVWDAVDQSGNSLSSGVYFIKLMAGDGIATQKVIFMK